MANLASLCKNLLRDRDGGCVLQDGGCGKRCWNHDRGSYQQVVGASATDFGEAFAAAFSLVYDLNSDLGEIILLPLRQHWRHGDGEPDPPCQPQGAASDCSPASPRCVAGSTLGPASFGSNTSTRRRPSTPGFPTCTALTTAAGTGRHSIVAGRRGAGCLARGPVEKCVDESHAGPRQSSDRGVAPELVDYDPDHAAMHSARCPPPKLDAMQRQGEQAAAGGGRTSECDTHGQPVPPDRPPSSL